MVLEAGEHQPGLHVYAHCLRETPGGVALVALNLDQSTSAVLRLPVAGQRYSLSADELQSDTVELNGQALALSGDALPELTPTATRAGAISLQPATLTFLALPSAGNAACQ